MLAGCQVWDLRKLKKVHEFTVSDKAAHSVAFDQSGTYLAAGGEGVVAYVLRLLPLLMCSFVTRVCGCHRSLFDTRDWSSVTSFADHTGAVTGVKFGNNAASIVSVSLDKNINVYGQ